MKYKLNEMISLKINGQQGEAKVFGFEHNGITWVYHLKILEHVFIIKITEDNLIKGVDIITNGNTARLV